MNGDGVGLPLGHLPTIATVNSLLLSADMVQVKCFESLSSLPGMEALLEQLISQNNTSIQRRTCRLAPRFTRKPRGTVICQQPIHDRSITLSLSITCRTSPRGKSGTACRIRSIALPNHVPGPPSPTFQNSALSAVCLPRSAPCHLASHPSYSPGCETMSSQAADDTEPAAPPSKRRRVGLACNACRVRKSRYELGAAALFGATCFSQSTC
jgi:hypothetical protein